MSTETPDVTEATELTPEEEQLIQPPPDVGDSTPPVQEAVNPDEAESFPMADQPHIDVAKNSKGYGWMLVSSKGRRLACGPKVYSTLRELKADLSKAKNEIAFANMIKLY